MHSTKFTLGAIGAPIMLAVLWGCGGGGAGAPIFNTQPNVAITWDKQLLQAIRDVKPGPPIVARAIGVVHTAMYDAWAAYDSKAIGTMLGGTLRRPAAERNWINKEKAVSYAAHKALVDLFPTKKAAFDSQMANLGYDPNDVSTDPSTAVGVGNTAAQAVIDFRHHDGSNQLGDLHAGAYSDYTGYAPVNTVDVINDPNRWQPLRFSDGMGGFVIKPFIAPHWGLVTPFAIPNASSLRPPPPALAGSTTYAEQAQELIDLEANLTDKQKMIAEYWADGPASELPPGHWCLFGQYVSDRDHHTLDQDIKMFFLIGNAVMDSSICCWESKRYYDYCRPITAIRYLFSGHTIKGWRGPGLGVGDIDGKNWIPYQPATFVTPPFAEYTSGHSTFSASGAEVLKRFTNSDYFGASVTFAPGSSKTEPGVTPAAPVTLSWATFSEAADEAGFSRRYGGIHFEAGDLEARKMGREIGTLVWEKAQKLFNGVTP